jgi:raffinose/stachyose/melibiose transport system substrate-binding protein
MRSRSASVVLTLAAVLAASAAAQGRSPHAGAAGEAPPDLTGVELVLWVPLDTDPGIDRLVEGFEAATGAAVDTQALGPNHHAEVLTRWSQGDRPDLLLFDPSLGSMLDLDAPQTLADLSDEAFVDETRFGLLDTAGNVDGRQYAAVIGGPQVYGMFYDRDVFPDAGHPIPTTLDEWYADCSAGDPSQDITFMHLAPASIWPLDIFPMLLWADAVDAGLLDELNAGSTTYADIRFEEAVNALNSSGYRGCLGDGRREEGYEEQIEGLIDDRVAMIPQGSQAVFDLVDLHGLELVDQKVGFFPLSFRSPRATWSLDEDDALVVPINADPARQAAALELIRYATGPGYAHYLEGSTDLPVLDGYEPPPGVPAAILDAYAALDGGPAPAHWMAVRTPAREIDTYLSEMLDGLRTPTDVVQALADDAQQMGGG